MVETTAKSPVKRPVFPWLRPVCWVLAGTASLSAMETHPFPHRIVGFDPGLNTTGYGVVEWSGRAVRLLEAGTVRSRSELLETRLAEIHAGVR